MGFWDFLSGGTPEEKRRREEQRQLAKRLREAEIERQRQDIAALEAGGIPISAKERLHELGSKADDPGAMFTSNLAPDELALLRRHGYKARGLVTGSAMYHVGTIYVSGTGDSQAPALSQAYDHATFLAVDRMQQEVNAIGAHGVVGVRLRIVRHEWSEKCIEVQLVGTAIEGPVAPKAPWISDLSGQEWFALHRAGYEPVGLVWGHAAWFIFTTQQDANLAESSSFWTGGMFNQEMDHWSQALGTARHLAMNHVYDHLKRLQATGIMGVKIERRLDRIHLTGTYAAAEERIHHNLLISIIGTAVRPTAAAPKPVRATVPILSLRDGRMVPAVLMADETLSVEA